MIKHQTSSGERVSQATIDKRRSETYRKMYQGPHPNCEGCGKPATCTAHIIPQARAKQLHKTELCWLKVNMFPACYECNLIAENVSSEKITELWNYERIKQVLLLYDKERYSKLPL